MIDVLLTLLTYIPHINNADGYIHNIIYLIL